MFTAPPGAHICLKCTYVFSKTDSEEMWDTDVCFLHSQLVGTNARLPKIPKTSLPVLILSPQSHKQNLSLGIDPIDNAEPCYPHHNFVAVTCVMIV